MRVFNSKFSRNISTLSTEFVCLCACFPYSRHVTSLKDFVMGVGRLDAVILLDMFSDVRVLKNNIRKRIQNHNKHID